MVTRSQSRAANAASATLTAGCSALPLPPEHELLQRHTMWLPPLGAEDLAELKRQVQAAAVHRVLQNRDGGRTITVLRRADVPMTERWGAAVREKYGQAPASLMCSDAAPLGACTAVPDQDWHRDGDLFAHVFIGVALTDVTDASGPMEFNNGFRAVGPAGSRWLFTQRIEHRGSVNRDDTRTRSILLLGHRPAGSGATPRAKEEP